jgi:uncharacterized protein (AIM24 family)
MSKCKKIKLNKNNLNRIRPKKKNYDSTRNRLPDIWEEMQYVEIELDPQEIVIADPGSYDDGQ